MKRLLELPQRQDIQPLWETNRWDGPTAGHGLLDGSMVYWKMDKDRTLDTQTEEHRPNRTFLVFALSELERQEAREQHDRFMRWVRTGTTYSAIDDIHQPAHRQRQFYEVYIKATHQPDPIAWFVELGVFCEE